MRRLCRRLRRDGGGDRGSMALFVIVFVVAVLALGGLVTDAGSAMNAKQRGADAAEQAARAAANDVSLTSLRQWGTAVINTDTACADATQVISQYAKANTTGSLTLDGCTYWCPTAASAAAAGDAGWTQNCKGAGDPGPTRVEVNVTVTSPPPAFFPPNFKITMAIQETACAMSAQEAC